MKDKTSFFKKIATCVALVVFFFAGGAFMAMYGGGNASSVASLAQAQDIYSGNPIVQIVKQNSPAVVNIDTETIVTRNTRMSPFQGDPFFEEFFGQIMPQQQQVPLHSKGSGFIISKEGYILTNNHVIEGANTVKVTLMDGRSFDAEKVGQDPTFDLAVIKIKAGDLPVLELGDSDKTDVGEWVVAIGNSLGFENSVTTGVISAKNRTLQAPGINFQGFLQTDAAINPGNSGGPLIDLSGRVVGINTAIVPYAQGIGFAVPINMAKQIMDDLIKHGEVRRGWLGVTVQQLNTSLVDAYRLPVKEGAIVADVQQGSPAEKSGVQRGDVIVSINGEKVKNSQDVVFFIRKKMRGEKVDMEVYRNGKKQTVGVVLGAIEGGKKEVPVKDGNKTPGQSQSKSATQIGITVSEITSELRDRYKLKNSEGLVVIGVERGTQGQRIGIRPGDVIIEVNKARMVKLADWEKAMSSKGKALAMLVARDGATIFISVGL